MIAGKTAWTVPPAGVGPWEPAVDQSFTIDTHRHVHNATYFIRAVSTPGEFVAVKPSEGPTFDVF